jgi:hypothetical protein
LFVSELWWGINPIGTETHEIVRRRGVSYFFTGSVCLCTSVVLAIGLKISLKIFDRVVAFLLFSPLAKFAIQTS